MNSQQAASDKLSNPSEHMEGCQELVESGTPTSVASSTRYKDLPTWSTEINEPERHANKTLQGFEQDNQVAKVREDEWDADEIGKWIQSQVQGGLNEDFTFFDSLSSLPHDSLLWLEATEVFCKGPD
ncbi:uncharacterized protein PG998_014706 [Apiospora kogelbergensis]|uniref:uncharacterized protein n=1 Tax=Apiospora kogelbergensis TaxID=1337665 RepID=UPI00313064DB